MEHKFSIFLFNAVMFYLSRCVLPLLPHVAHADEPQGQVGQPELPVTAQQMGTQNWHLNWDQILITTFNRISVQKSL